VPLRGLHGVPNDATAVAVQVAAAEGTSAGFVSLVPSGSTPGSTANLNLDRPGEIIANMAIVPIGPDGAIVVYPQASTHVIVDLLGWWTPSSVGTRAGRFQALGPTRLLDTRPDSAVNFTGAKPAAGAITTVQVTGVAGVPTKGVSAVVLNVAATESAGAGYVQAAPRTGFTVGASSTVNLDHAGQTISASTIVPVDANGQIGIYTMTGTHLVVDVAGWFTDGSSPAGVDGMFVALAQVSRLTDSRPPSGVLPYPPHDADLAVAGRVTVGNLALTSTTGPGWVQLGPSTGFVVGASASINAAAANQTISNAFIVPSTSQLHVHTLVDTHYIIDVSGSMT
jgi:hypothetical protein